ncbi:MAG: hypothetical protein ACYC35_27720, partial [Pirellulales bacterium]
MRNRIIWCCLVGGVLFVAGYLTAVVSFRREVWVDYRSGARKTTSTLFPFSISETESNDAFWVLFGRPNEDDSRASWAFVADERFVYPERLFVRRYPHYQSEDFVQAENKLVGSILWDEHDGQYRAHLWPVPMNLQQVFDQLAYNMSATQQRKKTPRNSSGLCDMLVS